MRERILAITGAAALIALAVVVRTLVAGGDDGDDGRRNASGPGSDGGDGAMVVACTPDLARVCAALAERGEIAADPPRLDLPGAVEPPEEVEAWITWSGGPEVAGVAADQAGSRRPWAEPVAAMEGSVGISTTPAGREALTAAGCAPVTLDCLAGAAVDGALTLGVGDPTRSEGLARLAAVAPPTDEVTGRPEQAALDTMLDGRHRRTTAYEQARAQIQPALGADVVLGPSGVVTGVAETAGGRARDLQVIDLEPATALHVVVAGRGERDVTRLAELLRGDDLVDLREELGLTPADGDPPAVDAGARYQLWRAVA